MRRIETVKTVSLFYVVLLLIFLTSCQKEVQQISSSVEVGFYAGGTHTRTEMDSNGLSTSWVPEDEIAVWAKNSSGAYTLSNHIFKTYGIDSRRGFFTSVLDSEMPDDTYTYYCCYPSPSSISGSKATFNIPSKQDGKVSGGADVMIATPVQYGPMTAVPTAEDHSGMRMQMNRMIHQFRFYVPHDEKLLGDEKIERLLMTFPSGVVGDVSLDVENPAVPAVLSNARSDVDLTLAEPIGVSSGDEYQFACLGIVPVRFDDGESLQIVKAYTDDKIVFFDPIDLKAKNCQPGHSTPVMLRIREIADYAGIIYLSLDTNNLGENPQKITLTAPEGCVWGDGGTNVYTYDPGREITAGEVMTFKFETDLESYKAFSGKQITVTYDSENAVMHETLTMPAITAQGSTSLSLTVPYLLYEDFSCVYAEEKSYGKEGYASDDRSQDGYSLDGCMSHTGWSAARYWTMGNSMCINTRYQCVKIILEFASYHHGRLDSPPLSGLKSGRSVNLRMSFNAGGNVNDKSSADMSDLKLNVATHTTSGVLDGIPTGTAGLGSTYETTLSDFGKRQDSVTITDAYGSSDFNSTFPSYETLLLGANDMTRIVFYPSFTGGSGIVNGELNVYIDNIKVQIAE